MGVAFPYPGSRGDRRTDIGDIFIPVVQDILLFGLETWVDTPRIVRMFGGTTTWCPGG